MERILSPDELNKPELRVVTGKLNGKFDVAVDNFSLFGKESVDRPFEVMPSLLTPKGTFIIQTIYKEPTS